jgi:nitrate/TMAO reductase-like tetraheme cytochrome c subunit
MIPLLVRPIADDRQVLYLIGRMRWPGSVGVLAAAAAAAPLGWLVVDRLEQDNDFCNACHLEADVKLHAALRRDFDAATPVSLAARHARVGNEARADGGFRCIDCHGGTSFVGRARVKVLAAKDAFYYVVGRFEEPESMRWPLWDEDCAKCHSPFDERQPEPWEHPRFHQLAVHNVELGVACVECHLTHDQVGRAVPHFLHASPVRARCLSCHPKFEEGGG